MLAASMCREVHFTVLPPSLVSTVPRCLFGQPNAKDTVDLLQEALEMERAKFSRRWGVDPRSSEDKENKCGAAKSKPRTGNKSPRKRSTPYSRQTNIHDFWRSRKAYDSSSKKIVSTSSSSSSSSSDDVAKQTSNNAEISGCTSTSSS
ncbi:uncharacterized protein [Neodiprion pinetum]|uniref:uncharacterized protein LOC124180773 n=1 Tax=Neodiprion fabricii TaxID=2872261 RepID=UPI001ED9756A|nr:uncharacterized protein LOC124180773 [Neodiprion fabricii]XP_046477101.1 uncharacterized protein LOC124216548 [Neodiprion pinetum]XP_046615784.1 uncharacterized protein LOC124303068 [Neodiprion virginianus]